jgi:hypothetical protein
MTLSTTLQKSLLSTYEGRMGREVRPWFLLYPCDFRVIERGSEEVKE